MKPPNETIEHIVVLLNESIEHIVDQLGKNPYKELDQALGIITQKNYNQFKSAKKNWGYLDEGL